jgi:hypothetical protein
MEICLFQARRIARIAQRRLREFGGIDLTRAVMARAQFLDPLRIDIEARHRHAGAGKRDRDWKADIAKADDSYLASMLHENVLPPGALERNPAKWKPVCRKIALKTKESRV